MPKNSILPFLCFSLDKHLLLTHKLFLFCRLRHKQKNKRQNANARTVAKNVMVFGRCFFRNSLRNPGECLHSVRKYSILISVVQRHRNVIPFSHGLQTSVPNWQICVRIFSNFIIADFLAFVKWAQPSHKKRPLKVKSPRMEGFFS